MTEDRFADRFRALAEAYGADIGRWPADARDAARAFTAAHPDLAEAALAPERRLEVQLAAFAPDASSALRQRVIAAAPRGRALGRAWRWMTAAGLGLGLAASCAAGVAAGFTLAPSSVTRLISGEPAGGSTDDMSGLADPAGDAANG